ncbi:hypothetical protein FRC04_002089 [Tulasnella sp. 424]|nr:hypothetical protein FRC04_002089 [Tulasnella sp. 424]
MALLDILLDVGDSVYGEPSLWKDRSFSAAQNAAQRCRSFQIRGEMFGPPQGLPAFGGWRILGIDPQRGRNGPNGMETALELPSSVKLTIERPTLISRDMIVGKSLIPSLYGDSIILKSSKYEAPG